MTRRYVPLAVLSFAAYSLVAPLLSVAMVDIPTPTAVFLSNAVLLLVVGTVILVRREPLRPYLAHPYRRLLVLMGLLLTVGLLSYYRALALGPVSVVVPIYGLFIVISSAIGVLALEERLTPRKAAGVGCSVLAIILISL